MSGEKNDYAIPKRMVIVIMASLATAIQYTIRSNLSVTIVAMVNNTEPQDSIDHLLNETQKSKIIGCPVPDQFLNSSYKAVQHELKGPKLPYTELETGGLLGSFFYGYIFTHVYAGQISTNFGPKKTIFVSLLLSGLLQMATPYSTNFDSFVPITLRVLIGMSQGVMSPAIYTLFSSWVPRTELSLSFSFFTIGSYLGSIVGVVLSGIICEYLDWRGVFYAFGFMALLFSVVWWFFVHDNPTQHPNINEAEIVKIFSGLDISKDAVERNTISYKLEKDEKGGEKKPPAVKRPGANVPWLKLLTSKEVWVVATAKFTLSWGNILLMSKLPSYLDRILHMPMQSNSMINAIIFFCLGIFALMFGALSDQIARKGWLSKLTSRKLFESIALFGSGGCLMLVPLAPCSPYVVVCLMIASSCFYAAMTGGDNVIVCDLTTKYSGSVYGITNAVGSLPGFLAPIFVGFLLSIDESIYHWNLIYIISGLIAFFGGIIFLLFASCEPLDLDSKPTLKTKLASMKSIKSIAADISIKPVKENKSLA